MDSLGKTICLQRIHIWLYIYGYTHAHTAIHIRIWLYACAVLSTGPITMLEAYGDPTNRHTLCQNMFPFTLTCTSWIFHRRKAFCTAKVNKLDIASFGMNKNVTAFNIAVEHAHRVAILDSFQEVAKYYSRKILIHIVSPYE